MIKKMFAIFKRDLKVNTRDTLSLYLMIAPLLLGFAINAVAPSINDTTVKLALIEGENADMAQYMQNFAEVQFYSDEEEIRERVSRRDSIVGILPDGDEYYILNQGNETEMVINYTKVIKTFYEKDISLENANAEIIDFGKDLPPLKKMLVSIAMLMLSVMGGMLIGVNIVEEKADNTISAMNVTTVPRQVYVLGKSMIGVILPIYGSIAILLITGYIGVNIGQAILVILSTSLLSILIGFVEGLKSEDIMEAASSIKMLFLPIAAGVAGYEAVSQNWQFLFYWIPFYWAYRANDLILNFSGSWGQILLYTGLIVAICALAYLGLAPKVRKGLEQ
jgi:ABC-2 type transport system permease protein